MVLFACIDMVIDQRNFFSIVRSWFGHKTLLKCGVIHRANTKPRFKWVRKSAIIFREDIFRSSNTSILTIEPANNTDFGEYICEARTKMAVVKQTFRVVKIGKAFILYLTFPAQLCLKKKPEKHTLN